MKLRMFVKEVGIWLTHYLEISYLDNLNSSVYESCALCLHLGREYKTIKGLTATLRQNQRTRHECTHTPEEVKAYLEKRSILLAEMKSRAAEMESKRRFDERRPRTERASG